MPALFELPHVDARRALATGAPVYLTVNPVEYHGPHLSLHNDRLVSQGMARDLADALAASTSRGADGKEWPALFGADLEVGVDPTPGLGTRATEFRTACRLVVDACEALAALGARRVVLLTFHGAPLHNLALEAGVRALARRGVVGVAPFHAVVRELVETDHARFEAALASVDPATRAHLVDEVNTDFHAGFFETSLALHYAPASVSPVHRELAPCPRLERDKRLGLVATAARTVGATDFARELDFAATALGWYALRPFPGYTGRPHLASATVGKVLAEAIVGRYREICEEVFAGAKPPRPVMSWLSALTLGGRIGRVPPELEELSGGSAA